MIMKVKLVSKLSEIYVPYLADACTSMPIQEKRVRKAIIIAVPQIYHEFSDFRIILIHSKKKPSQDVERGEKKGKFSASDGAFLLV